MDIRLLGLVSAHRSGRPIALGPRRQRFVLALEVNRAVPVDRLVELAWPVSAPRTRPARDPGVHVPAAVSPRGCRGGARRGADRHPGRFVHPAGRSRADRRPSVPCPPARRTALEDRLEARLRLGQHRAALGELADLIEVHPTRERLVELHMIALYRSGQAGPALAAYRQLRERLADDLGLDPGPRLRELELELAILRNEPELAGPAPAGRGTDRGHGPGRA